MALIVQKFGGTSVRDVQCIKNVASKIKEAYERGDKVVVVVSARAGVTHELIMRAQEINPNPNMREVDMLLAVGEQEVIALMAIALEAIGVPAVSHTGAQAGILTDIEHTRARILGINKERVQEVLNHGKVVIVAGFQGISEGGNITTLGRGGSDLTAIALSAVLKADFCQIFTDVDGVYTADPRIVPEAMKIEKITYEEMLELSSLGARVMQSRAVEFAQKYDVPFEVRSSFSEAPGTLLIKGEGGTMEEVLVRGVVADQTQAQITVDGLPDNPGSIAKLFKALANAKIMVDMIVQNPGREGRTRLTFTVKEEDLGNAKTVVRAVSESLGCTCALESDAIAILSVVGIGMRTHSGVAAMLFEVLANNGVNIQAITTSEINVSCAISREKGHDAVRWVHKAFKLDEPESRRLR